MIYEASKGSAYFENEQRKAAQVEERMKTVKKQLDAISTKQIERAQISCNKWIHELDATRDLSRTWIQFSHYIIQSISIQKERTLFQ